MEAINLVVLCMGAMIIFISRESAALSCLQCQYTSAGGPRSNASCNDPPTAAAVPCPKGVACTKIYQKTKSGTISILRDCDITPNSADVGDPTNTCISYTLRGITSTTCECITDSCNFAVSSILPLQMVAILGLSVAAEVLANFK